MYRYWLVQWLFEVYLPSEQYSGDVCVVSSVAVMVQVVFIEEDHVVSRDFYRTAQLLSKVKNGGLVQQCSTLALGSYAVDFDASPTTLLWYSGFMNTGYGFNHTVWRAIRNNWDVFWEVDDDWDFCVNGLMKGDSPLLSGYQVVWD